MNTDYIKDFRSGIFLLIHVGFAALSTAYLFYLDEGYNSFKWMNNTGNWILFIVYSAFFLLMQWAVKYTLLKRYKGYTQTFLSAGLSCTLLVLALIILFIH